MLESQNTTTLRINDPAFNPTSVTAHIVANGDVEKVERDELPSDFGMAYGRMVKEVETKSTLQQISDGFKYAWTKTKLGFRKFGILLGIIPKVSQKTHPNVFHPEKEQRDVHNPMLKQLKNNPPKLKSVTGSSINDLERKRDRVFREQKKELFVTPERELRVNPPKLRSVPGSSINDLDKKRADIFKEEFINKASKNAELRLLKHRAEGIAEATEKKAKNAEHRAAVKTRKAELDCEAQLQLEAGKQLHEQKMKQVQESRDALIAKRIQKAAKHNERVEEISKKQTEWKANVAKHDPLGFEAVNVKRFMELELSLEALHKEIAGR